MITDETLIPEPHRFPRRLVVIVVAGILVAIAGVALPRTFYGSTRPQHYLTAPVQRTELANTVAATGPIAAARAVPLNFKNSGKVTEIDVKVGDTIKAGQVLARLDPADFQAQLRQAEANLASAQARLDGLLAGPRVEQTTQLQANLDSANQKLKAMERGPRPETVAQAEANLSSAQARLDAAQHPYTDADMTAAKTAVDQAQASLTSAQAKLDATKNPYTQADWSAALSAVDSAKAGLASAKAKLDQTKTGSLPADIAAQQAAVDQAYTNLMAAQDKLEQWKDGDKSGGGTSNSEVEQSLQSAQSSYDAAVAKLKQMNAGPLPSDLQSALSAVDSAQASYNSAVAKVDQMKKGPLATDVVQSQAGLDQAKANLASAQAKLALVQAGPQQTDVTQAQSAVDSANAQLSLARSPYTEEDIQQARNQVLSAEQALKLAQEPYTKQDIDGARAQVAAQQAQVDLARANLDATTLTAPSGGVVTTLSGATGQWLAGGSTSGSAASAASGANNSSSNGTSTFISLTDLSNLQVQAQVNEADVGRLQPGQPVTFTVDAFPGQTFKGSVAVVQPLGSTSQNVVSYPVLISIDQAQAKLLPGMTASVTVTVDERPNVPVVPSAAISFAQTQIASGNQSGQAASTSTGPAVLVVDSAGKATLHSIQIGTSNGQYTEAVSGLEPGQMVAIGVEGN